MIIPPERPELHNSTFFLKNGLVKIGGNQLFRIYTRVKRRGNGLQLQCVEFRLNIGEN